MAEQFNAFTQGVEPGGMRTSSSVRLLVCFVLFSAEQPLPQSLICDILTETSLANYFEINQAISDLAQNGTLSLSEDGMYSLSDTGNAVAAELENKLPLSVRERTGEMTKKLVTRYRREKENTIVIEKSDTGYDITFEVGHDAGKILKLTMFMGSYEQAAQLRDGFLANPTGLCENILLSLLGNS